MPDPMKFCSLCPTIFKKSAITHSLNHFYKKKSEIQSLLIHSYYSWIYAHIYFCIFLTFLVIIEKHRWCNGQHARLECGRLWGRTKDYKFDIFCFSAIKHSALMNTYKDWLVRNGDNVSEWSDICFPMYCCFSTKWTSSSSHRNVTCSCHDMAEILLTWCKTTITISLDHHYMFYSQKVMRCSL